ncbi:GntR family transcriptional regulator [Nesterenkonia ebinurensis]|uniref:GntR family transcriptional regulator n=1 Tax=Nesterenkonia ebinurensis TaxID=2608252 RepID=UPI00123CB265|nr:GntR family transcriptional regulator [Nesterenkonia ebinurensis]
MVAETAEGGELVDEGRPLFVQIAEEIESSVLDGSLQEGERAPSTNELAAFHRINPATAAKGINLLVDRGILIKRRGLGMFVAERAAERLRAERRQRFADHYLTPMLAEARHIGLQVETVIELLRERAQQSTDHE